MNSRKKNSERKNGSVLCLLLFLLTACVPPTVEEYHEININYKDPNLRRILDLQVRQELDSLLSLTNDPNPTYRLFAARAFSSFQAPEAYETLVKLLNDPFIEVKEAAAAALGQSRNSQATAALIEAFSQQDSIDVNNKFNRSILEAIGKLGPEQYLNSIASVNTYRSSDTLLVLGQANAIYQYGLRDIFDEAGDETMLKFLTENYPLSVKKMAAQYFYRFENANLDDAKFQVLKVMKEHSDPDIRMALATALTRKGYPDLQSEIFSFYEQENDYRVKCNILKQIQKYPYISVVERLLGELDNENAKVGIAAAEYLLNNGNAYDAPVYREYIKSDLNPFVQIKMHQAILRNSGRNSGSRNVSTAALKNLLASDESPTYVKAEVISALSEDSRNFAFLMENYQDDNPEVLNTKAVESLVNILKRKSYVTIAMKRQISEFLNKIIAEGKGGSIAAAVEAFNDEELDLKAFYEDTNFLSEALKRLVLPNELETYNALNTAIAKVNGQPDPKPMVSGNVKAINWELFDQYSSKPQVRIATSKGEILVELNKHDAVQSVMNIIDLIKTGYYNNKYFHRVVPNFVAQAGCPVGDGYGSLDYTIRSELSNGYYDDEGYIGFASAGPHTESTQWFITYSPTPHLNGKYTIFGKVANGMDIVHSLEVGDKINRISISN